MSDISLVIQQLLTQVIINVIMWLPIYHLVISSEDILSDTYVHYNNRDVLPARLRQYTVRIRSRPTETPN